MFELFLILNIIGEGELKLLFPSSTRIETLKYNKKEFEEILKENKLPPFKRKEIIFYRFYKEDSLLGTVLIDDIIGKHLPITFMVIIKPEEKIKRVEILKYREPYGGEIQNTFF